MNPPLAFTANGGFMMLNFHTWQLNFRACHVYHSLPEVPCYGTDIFIYCLWVINIKTWATYGSGSAVWQPWECETWNECLLHFTLYLGLTWCLHLQGELPCFANMQNYDMSLSLNQWILVAGVWELNTEEIFELQKNKLTWGHEN